MTNIHEEESLEKLEENEHEITDETLLVLIALMTSVHYTVANELRSFYQKYGKDGVVSYADARKWINNTDRRRRLNALLLAIQQPFNSAYPELEFAFRDMLKKVVELETTFFEIDIEFDDLTLRWGFDDLDWVDRLDNDVSKWIRVIQVDVKRGILQRKHIDDILLGIEKRFESIENVLESLSISETTAVGSITRHEIFEALGVDKYKFYTRADERTCEVCGSMHGLVFPMTAFEVGVTASPMHPRCRCWEVPIISE